MWTLSIDKPIAIRRVEKPLRAMVEIVSTKPWTGDRLLVHLGGRFSSPASRRASERPLGGNVETGYGFNTERVVDHHGVGVGERQFLSYWEHDLQPGEVVVYRRYNAAAHWGDPPLPDTVQIYVQQLWSTQQTKDLLDVARDEALSAHAITPTVYQLAREALPRMSAHGLFVALMRKELT